MLCKNIIVPYNIVSVLIVTSIPAFLGESTKLKFYMPSCPYIVIDVYNVCKYPILPVNNIFSNIIYSCYSKLVFNFFIKTLLNWYRLLEMYLSKIKIELIECNLDPLAKIQKDNTRTIKVFLSILQ